MSSAHGPSQRVVVYTPQSMLRSPAAMFREMVVDLLRSRELAWRLANRDIRAQYRGSFLGYLWAFITPLVNTVMWVFMSASGVIRVDVPDMPYPVFVFTGTMLWQIFTEAITMPQLQVNASKSMLAKLNFPREALLLSGIYKIFFGMLIKLAVLVPVVLLFGVVPDAHVLLVPVAMLALVLAGVAVGLLLVPVGTLYSDVGRFIPMATQFLMYLTPVVYAMPKLGVLAALFGANPITPLIVNGRAWLTGGATPLPWQFLTVVLGSFILLAIGWVLFRLAMSVIVERMGS
jgi:lipopolysaccharide transport system permease protein